MKTYLVVSKKNGLLYPFIDQYNLHHKTVKSRLRKHFAPEGYKIIGQFNGEVSWTHVEGMVMGFSGKE